MRYKITREKEIKSKKKEVLISVKQVREMYKEIDKETSGFIVWLEKNE